MRRIEDIRHENLLNYMAKFATLQAFADAVGRSHSQMSQLKNRSKHSRSGKPRNVDSALARIIEKRLGLPDYSMDVDSANTWPFPLIDQARWERLDPSSKVYVQGAMSAAIRECEPPAPVVLSTGEATEVAPRVVHDQKPNHYGT